MSIDYRGSFDFSELQTLIDDVAFEAVREAMGVVKDDAVSRAPEEDGDLKASAIVDEPTRDHAGITGSFTFTAPWARKEHEHLYYHHHGAGGPKFAELAIVAKTDEAIGIVADRIRQAIEG